MDRDQRVGGAIALLLLVIVLLLTWKFWVGVALLVALWAGITA